MWSPYMEGKLMIKQIVTTVISCLWLTWCGVGWAQQCTQAQLHDEFLLDPTARNYVTCATDGNLEGQNVSDVCVLDLFNSPCTASACKVENVLTREQIYETIIDA